MSASGPADGARSSRSRAVAVAVATFAAGLGLGVAVGLGVRAPTSERGSPAAGAEQGGDASAGANASASARGAGTLASRPDPHATSQSSEVEPATRDLTSAEPAPTAATLSHSRDAAVHVTLVVPEEWTTHEGHVYALPANGPRTGVDAPHAMVPAGATSADIALPVEGRWDVGYVARDGLGSALARDVFVKGRTPVSLAAGETARIRFRLPSSGPRPEGGQIRLSRPSLPSEREDPFPARGERPSLWLLVDVGTGATCETPPIDVGTACALEVTTPPEDRGHGGAPGSEWVLSRSSVRPGEDVDLLVRPLGLVRNRIRFTATMPADSGRGSGRRYVGVRARREEAMETYTGAGDRFVFDENGRARDAVVLLLPLPPGRFALWIAGDPSWQPSSRPAQALEVEAGRTFDVDWDVEPLPVAAVPGTTEAAEPHPVSAVLRLEPAPVRGWSVATEEEQKDGRLEWNEWNRADAGEATVEVESILPVRRAIVWAPPDRASLPFDMPKRGTTDVRTVPAGMVVLVPEGAAEPSLGPLRVRRTDGVPLPVFESRDGGKWSISVEPHPEAHVGRCLGPIPEGPLELEVTLGGVEIGRVKVNVRAGVNTPLVLPIRARTPR